MQPGTAMCFLRKPFWNFPIDMWTPLMEVSCRKQGTCLCQQQPSFHMRLRGLCANSAIDKYFQPMNDFHNIGRLQLIGHTMSTIEYDDMNKYWKMSLAWSNVSGLSHAAKNTFALGKQSWSITGDTGCKADGKEYTVLLKLTVHLWWRSMRSNGTKVQSTSRM